MAATGLLPYQHGFGVKADDPLEMDLAEAIQLIERLAELGVAAVNISCGSPYYNPHIQRPAIFPPSDGYLPPEDPLVGVVRQIRATARLKAAVPHMPLVGSGYSYLQDYLPHVAQAVVRLGWVDSVGLGRMVLSYPELPADSLQSGVLTRKKVCRTFSDCTTAPRHGIISGCYPFDPYYKALPEAAESCARSSSSSRGGHFVALRAPPSAAAPFPVSARPRSSVRPEKVAFPRHPGRLYNSAETYARGGNAHRRADRLRHLVGRLAASRRIRRGRGQPAGRTWGHARRSPRLSVCAGGGRAGRRMPRRAGGGLPSSGRYRRLRRRIEAVHGDRRPRSFRPGNRCPANG